MGVDKINGAPKQDAFAIEKMPWGKSTFEAAAKKHSISTPARLSDSACVLTNEPNADLPASDTWPSMMSTFMHESFEPHEEM